MNNLYPDLCVTVSVDEILEDLRDSVDELVKTANPACDDDILFMSTFETDMELVYKRFKEKLERRLCV